MSVGASLNPPGMDILRNWTPDQVGRDKSGLFQGLPELVTPAQAGAPDLVTPAHAGIQFLLNVPLWRGWRGGSDSSPPRRRVHKNSSFPRRRESRTLSKKQCSPNHQNKYSRPAPIPKQNRSSKKPSKTYWNTAAKTTGPDMTRTMA